MGNAARSRRRQRGTYLYRLYRDGYVVYIGITNDPDRREREHWDEGKVFDDLVYEDRPHVRWYARELEKEALQEYRRWHDGWNPEYNETDYG
jgi:predicted GIY-YIG superfamily endonuclease